jgi:hypothetical protein
MFPMLENEFGDQARKHTISIEQMDVPELCTLRLALAARKITQSG